jgi:hypothetical protein
MSGRMQRSAPGGIGVDVGTGVVPSAARPAVVVGWVVERVRSLRPVHVGLMGSAMALAIVMARLAVPADGDVTRFVIAGDEYVDPATVDPEIYVLEDSGGYDGQFFWRLAVDPLEWEGEPHHGVHFDNAYRAPRLVYPALAWLTAGGQPELVAYTMVGINVVGYGVVAWLGAVLAQRGRKPALAGLVLAAIPGLVFALSRDLAEVVTMAAVLSGALALQRAPSAAADGADGSGAAGGPAPGGAGEAAGALALSGAPGAGDGPSPAGGAGTDAGASGRGPGTAIAVGTSAGGDASSSSWPRPGWAAVAWCVAVVSREQALLVVAGYGLWRVWLLVRGRVRPGRADLPWVVPPLVFAAWQGVLWLRLGKLPLADSSTNLAWPFTVLVPTVGSWFRGELDTWDRVVPAQLALAVVLVVLAVAWGRRLLAPDDRWLLFSLPVVVGFGASLGRPVWIGPADLRQVIDVFTVSWLVLLLCPRRLPPWLLGATAAIWLATAAVRSYAI